MAPAWNRARHVFRTLGFERSLLCLIVLAALITRLAFVVLLPYSSGDWSLYRNVAHNILDGCGVAVTVKDATGCTPHFGGNQLPLYPAFVAAVWYVFGQSELAVRIAQSVAASLSTAWLVHAILRSTNRRIPAVAAGIVLAVSPLQSYWAGSLLTETLALATTQWVLAELLLSYASGRLPIWPLGLAMIAASWTRMDAILLLAPVAVAALSIGGVRKGLVSLCLVGLIIAAPLGAWAMRNVVVGISPFPSPWVVVDGSSGPPGYFAWVKTWTVTETQRGDTLWFGPKLYERIKIDPRIYRDAAERDEVQSLLRRLQPVSGQPFPPDIDAAFRHLAERRRDEQSWAALAGLEMARAWSLTQHWIWPWTTRVIDGQQRTTPTDDYRFVITAGFLLTALAAAVCGPPVLRYLAGLALTYAVVRIAFLALTVNIETRYMIELAPFIECTAGMGAGWLIIEWRRRMAHSREPGRDLKSS